LSTIKVTYKNPNCQDSDSDADVVIEEEKEYDVAGDSVNMKSLQGAFSRLQMPFGPMPQYVPPIIPPSGSQGRGKTPPKTKKTSQMQPMTTAGTKLPAATTLGCTHSKKPMSAHTEQQKQTKPITAPERVQTLIRNGTRVMVLMRGAPGSGKTHLAVQMVRQTMSRNSNPNKFIFSTDDFFIRTKKFIPSLLEEAHRWNQERVRTAAGHKLSPIFVDNTNTEVS
jgi:hypothetical protein